MRWRIFIILVALLGCWSCGGKREIAYFQNAPVKEFVQVPEGLSVPLKISEGDIITVGITSLNESANDLFRSKDGTADPRYASNAFQVKSDGTVDIPLIGKMYISGLTLEQVEERFLTALEDYLQMPTVNVRLVNFKITVLGEVRNPGVFEVANGKITIMEALGLAGDMTIYGMRTNVLVVRKSGDNFEYIRFDVSDKDLMIRQDVYLQNNDVVYVEPTKGKISTDNNVYRVLPIILSSVTIVVLMVSLFNQ